MGGSFKPQRRSWGGFLECAGKHDSALRYSASWEVVPTESLMHRFPDLFTKIYRTALNATSVVSIFINFYKIGSLLYDWGWEVLARLAWYNQLCITQFRVTYQLLKYSLKLILQAILYCEHVVFLYTLHPHKNCENTRSTETAAMLFLLCLEFHHSGLSVLLGVTFSSSALCYRDLGRRKGHSGKVYRTQAVSTCSFPPLSTLFYKERTRFKGTGRMDSSL